MKDNLFELVTKISKDAAAFMLADRLAEHIDRIDREHDGMRGHP